MVEDVTSEKTNYILTDEVRFFDQSENFEGVSCPFCSSSIDMEWWSDVMHNRFRFFLLNRRF
jgi:hypothetical protein